MLFSDDWVSARQGRLEKYSASYVSEKRGKKRDRLPHPKTKKRNERSARTRKETQTRRKNKEKKPRKNPRARMRRLVREERRSKQKMGRSKRRKRGSGMIFHKRTIQKIRQSGKRRRRRKRNRAELSAERDIAPSCNHQPPKMSSPFLGMRNKKHREPSP